MRDKDFPTDKTELANYITANLSRDLQISPDAAWGIVQRLSHESGLVAGRQESDASKASVGNQSGLGGKGWAQWTGPRRQDFIAATKDNGGVMSPAANYQYLLADLTQNHPDLVAALRDPGMTTAKANQVFTQGYEMGRGPYAAKQFQPVQISSNADVAIPGAVAKAPGVDDLFAEHAQALPNTLAAPAAPAPTQAPTNAPAPTSGGVDDLFAEHAQPTNAEPAPAVAAPAPAVASPENPNAGKAAPALTPPGPQASLTHDVGAGGVMGGRGIINDVLDAPSNYLLRPLTTLGAAGYQLIAPHLGLPQMTKEQMADLNGTSPENGGELTGTPGQLVTQSISRITGTPMPEEVPAASPLLRNTVANVVASSVGGPKVMAAQVPATPVSTLAGGLVPEEYKPATELGTNMLVSAPIVKAMTPTPPKILPSVGRTALEGENAGGPAFRAGQISSDPAAVKADLQNNAEATQGQIQDFTKAVTKQAGVPSDEANTAWVQKVYKTAGDRMDAVGAKTGLQDSPELRSDMANAKADFDNSVDAADPVVKAKGDKLFSILEDQMNKGPISGKDYQNMTKFKSDISRFAREGGNLGDLARALRDAVMNQFARVAPKEDVAELAAARQQWNTARRLEPMVNDTHGLLDPRRVAKEFGGDQTDLGKIAASGGLLGNPTATGGVRGTGPTLGQTVRHGAAMVASPLAAIGAYEQGANAMQLMAAHPLLSGLGLLSAGGAGALALARAIAARHMSRPDVQRQIITRATMGAPPPPGTNLLLPGILGTQGAQGNNQ